MVITNRIMQDFRWDSVFMSGGGLGLRREKGGRNNIFHILQYVQRWKRLHYKHFAYSIGGKVL